MSLLAATLAVTVVSSPEEIIPTKTGTTWTYDMTEEAGPGAQLADENLKPVGIVRVPVMYRIEGSKEVDGRDLLQFEMLRSGRVTNTDLLSADGKGILRWGRIDQTGHLTTLDPPQPIVSTPVTVGTVWDFNNYADGAKVHQHYEIVGQDEIECPAGTFRAFHIRAEQDTPSRMTIDRWFTPGIGIVKDVTETRSDSGDLLRRISLELTEEPKVAARPQAKNSAPPRKLAVSIGSAAVGETRRTFDVSAPKIYARWQGRELRKGAKVRVLWVAEQVNGVAPPDYTIDEATAVATAPDSHGVMTLIRPDEGWAPGTYRVEFYVDSALIDSVKIDITRSPATRFGPLNP